MARSTRSTTPKYLAPENPIRTQPKRGAAREPERTPATGGNAAGSTKDGRGKKRRPEPLEPILEESPRPTAGPSPGKGSDNNNDDEDDKSEPQVHLEELSPTLSTGPEFRAPNLPDAAAVKAAGEMVYLPEPQGFMNKTTFFCYRNTTIVVLLSSSKIMSWIEHYYIPNLQAGGLTIDSVIAKAVSSGGQKPKGVLYTDTLCELNVLHSLWCNSDNYDQQDLEKAMDALWRWLKKEDRKAVSQWGTRFNGHQDAMEFLTYFVELAAEQLRHCIQTQERKTVPALDPVQLSLLEAVNIKEIITIEQTTRGLCVVCGGIRGDDVVRSKYRVEGPSTEIRWPVSLRKSTDDATDDGQPAAKSSIPRNIEDLLEGETKSLAKGLRCSPCYSEWEGPKDERLAEAEKRGGIKARQEEWKKIQQELEPILARKTKEWRRVRVLPEVLIIQLKRFATEIKPTRRGTEVVTCKDNTPVVLDEFLDLKPWVEHRGGDGVATSGSTRYRLTGIVNHFGDLDVGHYVADVRIDNTWHEVNDDKVSTDANLQTFLKKKGWTPYVLLYERCAVEDADEVDIVVTGEKDGVSETGDDANANVNATVAVTATATATAIAIGKGDGGGDDKGDDDDDSDDDNKGNRNDNKAKANGKGKGKDRKNGHDGNPDASSAGVPSQSPPRSNLLPVVQGFDRSRRFGIQIAQDALQKGQMSLKVRATINGCVVHFPTYVLSGCGMDQGRIGRHTAEIDMILGDHEDAEAQITARTILTLVPTGVENGDRKGSVESSKTSPGKKRKRQESDDSAKSSPSKKHKRQGNDESVRDSPGKESERDKGEAAKTSPTSQKGKRRSGSGGGKSPRSSPRTRAPTRSPIEPASVDNWKTKPFDGPGLDYEATPRNERGKSNDSDLGSLFGSP